MCGRSMLCSFGMGRDGTCLANQKRKKMIIIKIKEKIYVQEKHDSGE